MTVLITLVGLSGCSSTPAATGVVTFVSTTTTQDSGLLEVLVSAFESDTGIKVQVIAVGSGQALEIARRGDADLLLTHSPEAEQRFMDEGFGDQRHPVMHNDFVLMGPADDPAGIQKSRSVEEALQKIAAAERTFVSRSDDSGTHNKEQSLWKSASIDPQGSWYVRAGTGMAAALRIAGEKQAYILSDRGTCLAMRDDIALKILYEGDERLLNRYSVITLSSSKHPHLHHAAARRLAAFLTSSRGQDLIRSFGVKKYGEPLFIPDAGEIGTP